MGKKIAWGIVIALLALNVVIIVTGNTYMYKALLYNYADIDDLKLFPARTIAKGMPQPWPLAHDYNKTPMPAALSHELTDKKSVAFLVVRHDSICYEQYWDNYTPVTNSNSFSMAKTITSMLVGIAIDEGKIKSINDPVGNYLPEFSKGDLNKITIKDLLTMSASLNWDEAYSSIFSVTTKAYYGTDLKTTVLQQKPAGEPGKTFYYSSGNAPLLALVLQKVTGKTISEYLSEKVWQPIGAETDAQWSLDHADGLEKAYCCVYSNARDFARLGKLYMHKGNWNGKQIVSEQYVAASLVPADLKKDETGQKIDHYGYSWWLMPNYKGHHIFYARGLNGQYIFCIQDLDI